MNPPGFSARALYVPTLLPLAAAGSVTAHPPVSVIADLRGNVYYSDLKHVWMTVSRDGVVYLIDTLDLLRGSPRRP